MSHNLNLPNERVIPVMETFYSLQGEGAHSGKAAFFIRLAGCDIGCHWCDVKESWDAAVHPLKEINTLIKEAKDSGAGMAVITGGEPAKYDLSLLTGGLKKTGIAIHLETSGAYPVKGYFDWICISPKKRKQPMEENYMLASELKVIIYNHSDFQWAEKNAIYVPETCRLFLQPEWGRSAGITPEIIQYIRQNPRWQMSLQTHKYMGIR